MQFEFNFYSITLIISGIAASLFSAFIFDRLGKPLKWLVFTLLSVSVWAFSYGFKIASMDWSDMLFWVKIEYLGIALAPTTWVLFCIKYIGKESWLKKRVLFILFVFPFITYLLLLTNEWHFLHYKEVVVSTNYAYPYLALQMGPWFFVQTFYFYFMVLLGIYLLLTSFRHAEPIFRKHIKLLVITAMLPLMFSILYLVGYRPLGAVDPTPFTFIISFGILALGLIKFNLFDVIPIAKDKLVSAMTEGLLVIDLSGKVIYLNPAMKNFIGQSSGNYIGQEVSGFFKEQPELTQAIMEKGHTQIEISIKVKGQQMDLSVQTIPLIEKENIMGLLLLFRDITAAKKSQDTLKFQSDQLKKHNELKDKLFSIISHDLKGPILGVKEIIDMAKKGLMSEIDFREILPDLSKSVDGVTMLMENLLAWSRSQLKGEYLNKIEFDILKLLRQQINLMEHIASSKNVRVEIIGGDPVRVIADKDMVELVVRNLLNNSIKFCEIGDRIQVEITSRKDSVCVSVKDTGVGISISNLNRLRRGESFSTFGSNNESGTGLGLLLVRDYIEKNNGSLFINSIENEWSEFSFLLPKANVDSGETLNNPPLQSS